VIEWLTDFPPFHDLMSDLYSGKRIASLGIMRPARLALEAAIHVQLNEPVLILTDRADHALTIHDELRFWLGNGKRHLFPEPNPLFYEQAAWGNHTRRERLQSLTALASYHIPGAEKPISAPILIAPVRAVMARTLPRRDFLKASRIIRMGQAMKLEGLVQNWVEIGYSPSDTVLETGQFARRGGILDIWPPGEDFPVRIEFFGDEVDTLRAFDPASQRTLRNLDHFLVGPAREFLPTRATAIGLEIKDVDEFHLPCLHPAVASILDYMPKNSLVVVDDFDLMRVVANEIEEQAVKLRQESIREGTLAADFPIPYLSFSEINDSLASHHWIDFGRSDDIEAISELSGSFEPGPRFGGRLKPLMEELVRILRADDKVVMVSRQSARLRELWNELPSELTKELSSRPEFVDGTLSDGFIFHVDDQKRLLFLTDSEIFGWERPRPRQQHRPRTEAPEANYADLRPGDWVVHIDYGVGRYAGLVRRTLDGTEREFLCVEYEKGDQLFVPVHQADRLSRYVGPEGETPSATRLGTAEWSQAKQKVREAVQEVAQEMLELYARRQLAIGFAFKSDTPWQQELEASFPYIETADQLTAIADVKRDMEAPRPMDRLLCGDVGYGKTEVALRAAFKAVMEGRQVAVLVPTTVLAQQHYDTFRQRLAAFPVQVEMLSRFRSHKEQDAIIKLLRQGGLDIIIGTHRLIQADVEFKDLGLVIIDEEQRFGVTHKDYFKRLRAELDVLTLTATPIPRTLYMALTGVRDISNINTPPEERLPIVTHIGPYSPRLVRQAVMREMERGGQIFFVHNRVQTIRAMESHLHNLVPDARVGVAHGQMPEQQLANVMHQFTAGDLDILLCTSIIESGLDIPNANTLIVDRGDAFGLAQLYQLRGRVGRGAQRAYAYFFRHRQKPPTPEGQERLEVIAENIQLGAGYSIAMRDLEMRGAGELLGTRQHGYIASVGFHLYTRLLAQAVRTLRKVAGLPEPPASVMGIKEVRHPVNVELPLVIGIPMEYVPDQNVRLRLYRRLADAENEQDLHLLAEEFRDRFGLLPERVENLIFQIRIKQLAEEAGLVGVVTEGDQVCLQYPPLPENINARALSSVGSLARVGRNAYWMPIHQNGSAWQERLIKLLLAIIKP
jgi:transcription-repair coupling factor (superfamily II helicase)